jgi:CheY-like chemotaxis protein
MILERMGASVTTAVNGALAVDARFQEEPDLILMDCQVKHCVSKQNGSKKCQKKSPVDGDVLFLCRKKVLRTMRGMTSRHTHFLSL